MRGGLKFQLTVAFNMVIVLMIAMMGIALAGLMRAELLRRGKESLLVNLQENSNTLDYFYTIYLAKSDTVFLDRELAALLVDEDPHLVSRIAVKKGIQEKLSRQLTFDLKYPEVRNSYYFGGSTLFKLHTKNPSLVDGIDFLPYAPLEADPLYAEFMTSKRMFFWKAFENQKGVRYVSFSRRLLDTDSYEDTAMLEVLLPHAKVRNILQQGIHSDVEAFVYLDEAFQPIVGGGAAEAGQFVAGLGEDLARSLGGVEAYRNGRRRYLVGTVKSDLTGWYLAYAVPQRVILANTRYAMVITGITCVVTMLLCACAATLISSRITRRISMLVRKTEQVAAGSLEFGEELRDRGSDEIFLLHQSFDHMSRQIRELHHKEFRSKILLNEVRAELLQEQLNPHLLYNTLSMIKLIARQENQTEVFALTDSLINFYKGVLNRGGIVSPIHRELFMIRNFIEVTKKVYELDLEVRIDVPEEVLELYTVKLFLQPLVENAVLHGIRPNGGGTLSIKGEREGDSLRFAVSDDGIGMEEGVLEGIAAAMGADDIPQGGKYTGYGVLNVYKRFRLFFGENGNMAVKSRVGEGTVIEITVPAFTLEQITRWLGDRHMRDV